MFSSSQCLLVGIFGDDIFPRGDLDHIFDGTRIRFPYKNFWSNGCMRAGLETLWARYFGEQNNEQLVQVVRVKNDYFKLQMTVLLPHRNQQYVMFH